MIASEPNIFAFSRLKFVGKSHIMSGQFRAVPPPPPPSGYTLVGLMQSDNLFARGEKGKWMHKLVF